MGGNWPATAALYAISLTTVTETVCTHCLSPGPKAALLNAILRNGAKAAATSPECGCQDIEVLDGYYLVGLLSVGLGVSWLFFASPLVKKLEAKPSTAWLAPKAPTPETDDPAKIVSPV